MKAFKIILCLMVCSEIAISVHAEQTNNTTKSNKTRIGVYDSRSIAVAFVGSEAFNARHKNLKAKHEVAKSANNKKLIAELEAKGKAWQKQVHNQGFGTASVSNILEYIKNKLPKIIEKADVEIIVSKWDKTTLSKYKSVEQIDVTMLLIDALKPNAKQRKSAIEIQKHKPVPMKKLEKMMKKGCH